MSSQLNSKIALRVTEQEDQWLDYMTGIGGFESKSETVRQIIRAYRLLMNDDAYRSLAKKAPIIIESGDD